MKSLKSLIITTSAYNSGDQNNKTGVWMEDLAAPYWTLKDGGEFITIASPSGGLIPVDPKCRRESDLNTERFEKDANALYQFSHSIPLNELKSSHFDLVFLAGGYGAMEDFNNNECLNKLLTDFIDQGKPIGLVGHAVVALLSLKDKQGGTFVRKKKITCFTNEEEGLANSGKMQPFFLETQLRQSGADFKNGAAFEPFVVTEQNIITGQNPASAVKTAQMLLSGAHGIVSKPY